MCAKPQVNAITCTFRSILPWAKMWPAYFYWQKLTCASTCERMCMWNESLVMIRMTEPQHMKITLTGSIHEHVSEVSSRSLRLRMSGWSNHYWKFIKCDCSGFGNARKRKLSNIRKDTWKDLIYYVYVSYSFIKHVLCWSIITLNFLILKEKAFGSEFNQVLLAFLEWQL